MLTTYTVSSLGEYYDVIHKISRSNAQIGRHTDVYPDVDKYVENMEADKYYV